jgi:hypothetical protein
MEGFGDSSKNEKLPWGVRKRSTGGLPALCTAVRDSYLFNYTGKIRDEQFTCLFQMSAFNHLSLRLYIFVEFLHTSSLYGQVNGWFPQIK